MQNDKKLRIKYDEFIYIIYVYKFKILKKVANRPFMCMGYVNSVPRELDEAARIDGCGFFRIYWNIILSMLKPVMATIAILSFRQGWNEYIMPMVFTMTNPKLRPLTVGVNLLKNAGDGAAAWNIMFAGATIAIIPILIVFCCFSRFFMGGLTAGAVKG